MVLTFSWRGVGIMTSSKGSRYKQATDQGGESSEPRRFSVFRTRRRFRGLLTPGRAHSPTSANDDGTDGSQTQDVTIPSSPESGRVQSTDLRGGASSSAPFFVPAAPALIGYGWLVLKEVPLGGREDHTGPQGRGGARLHVLAGHEARPRERRAPHGQARRHRGLDHRAGRPRQGLRRLLLLRDRRPGRLCWGGPRLLLHLPGGRPLPRHVQARDCPGARLAWGRTRRGGPRRRPAVCMRFRTLRRRRQTTIA